MDRRSFLALLASAPIAALAPLPKILEEVVVDRQTGISIRFVKHWEQLPPRYAIWNPNFAVRVQSD